ncbi:MAG: TA system VapC family ribonuclease toxin [Vicinamibacterales bacterium]
MSRAARVALLDVNVLVALFDPDHVHHEIAHDWFADRESDGWATCPITENGFVRVVANPAYGSGVRSGALVENLRKFRGASSRHAFWPAAASLTDDTLFNTAMVSGYRQLTDIYLLGLAHKMGGCLATFDKTIPLKAVVGAKATTLELIAPV